MKIKKIKWWRWLLLGIWITAMIIEMIASDIAKETLENMKLKLYFMPYIENYYQFLALIQLCHLVILFTALDIMPFYLIYKGIRKDVKEKIE